MNHIADADIIPILEFVISELRDPELLPLALSSLAHLTALDSDHHALSRPCTEPLLALTADASVAPDTRLLAAGVLHNALLRSEDLCFALFKQGKLLTVTTEILNESDPPAEVVAQLMDSLIHVISAWPSEGSVLFDGQREVLFGDALIPYVDIFLSGFGCFCLENLVAALSVCLARCPDIAGYVAERGAFATVGDLIVAADGEPLFQAMSFVTVVLTKCSRDVRALLLAAFPDFPAQWLAVGQRDNAKIIAGWARDTAEILEHNWAGLLEPFVAAGVISHLFFCTTQSCFKIRKAALKSFLRHAERLPTAALAAMVRDGMIGDIAEFSSELEDEQSVGVLQFLRFLLTAGLDATFIQEVHGAILSSALVPAVEEMKESEIEIVRVAALAFHEDFLDTSRYLEEIDL
jgi:hypothetical protein